MTLNKITTDLGTNPDNGYDSPISSIEDILEDARNGRPYILVDAEDRENEGDVVIPAQMATPDIINFMARFGRGLHCLGVGERGLCGLSFREGAIQAIVAGCNRVNNLPVRVVEKEIGCEKPGFGCFDSGTPGPEIEQRIVDRQRGLKNRNILTKKCAAEQHAVAPLLCQSSDGHGREKGSASDAEFRGALFGEFPCRARFRVVRFGKVDELGERVFMVRIEAWACLAKCYRRRRNMHRL